jgi:hypothetical protein
MVAIVTTGGGHGVVMVCCAVKREVKRRFSGSLSPHCIYLRPQQVRKLQFLMAEALEAGADSIITCGGEQSNHARATAMAAATLGLEPHLILRTDRTAEELGLEGNLLLDRLSGARIWLATKAQWTTEGSDKLVARVKEAIEAGQGGTDARSPYVVGNRRRCLQCGVFICRMQHLISSE